MAFSPSVIKNTRGDAVPLDRLEELLRLILSQQQISNLHLTAMTNEEFTESDVPDRGE